MWTRCNEDVVQGVKKCDRHTHKTGEQGRNKKFQDEDESSQSESASYFHGPHSYSSNCAVKPLNFNALPDLLQVNTENRGKKLQQVQVRAGLANSPQCCIIIEATDQAVI